MTVEAWLLIGTATFTGAVIQTATGMGFALITAPVFVWALSPTQAVAALLMLTAATNVAALMETRGQGIQWSVVRRVLPASLLGLPVGLWVLIRLGGPVLQVAIGFCVVAWVSFEVFQRVVSRNGERSDVHVSSQRRKPSLLGDVAVGITCGVLTTSSGLNGPPLAAWYQRYLPTSNKVKDSLQVSFLFLTLAGLCVMGVEGHFQRAGLGIPMLVALAAMLVGAKIGSAIYRKMSEAAFANCLLLIILAAGALSLTGGIAAL